MQWCLFKDLTPIVTNIPVRNRVDDHNLQRTGGHSRPNRRPELITSRFNAGGNEQSTELVDLTRPWIELPGESAVPCGCIDRRRADATCSHLPRVNTPTADPPSCPPQQNRCSDASESTPSGVFPPRHIQPCDHRKGVEFGQRDPAAQMHRNLKPEKKSRRKRPFRNLGVDIRNHQFVFRCRPVSECVFHQWVMPLHI